MVVASGREFLSIPGPTTLPDEVLAAMHRPAVDIYSGPLLAVTESCHADLRKVFCTEAPAYIYACNGHGAWEAALANVLSRGDKILVLASGRFAEEVNFGHWFAGVVVPDPQAFVARVPSHDERLAADLGIHDIVVLH